MMRTPLSSDWAQFYRLAAIEGWRVPQAERQLLQGAWSHFAHVLEIDGVFAGLVTAVPYEQSGWIGNLIVPEVLRGRGYGVKLFRWAMACLAERGMKTFWLTASELGQPIYEKFGFSVINEVERWVCPPRKYVDQRVDKFHLAGQSLCEFDRSVWTEIRATLLDHIIEAGQVFASDDSLALLQKGQDEQILGPWYSNNLCPRANRFLLQQVMAAADPSIEIVADILTSTPLRPLLAAAGFAPTGSTRLMVKGASHKVNLNMMVAMASLGSVG
jgi:GNAT superfamily N-acetyltransferase